MYKNITLHEGECESSLIEWLKLKDYPFGRTIKQVLSEIKNIERILNKINKHTVVTVIMDCDTLIKTKSSLDRLEKNFKWLIAYSKKVYIITQNLNLEDELTRGLKMNKHQDLYRHFNTGNKKTYKQTLAQMSPERLEAKLNILDFDLFWSEKIIERFTSDEDIITCNVMLNDIK